MKSFCESYWLKQKFCHVLKKFFLCDFSKIIAIAMITEIQKL